MAPSWIAFMVTFLQVSSGLRVRDALPENHQCEPITVDHCRGLGYNFTKMPNLVGDYKQQDAYFNLQSFAPLIQIGCSSQIKLFLCAAFVPMCSPHVPDVIGPCRSLCESVRDRCSYVMDRFGVPWPVNLNCSKFPKENNHLTMCMEGPGEREDVGGSISYAPGQMPPRRPDPPPPLPPPFSNPSTNRAIFDNRDSTTFKSPKEEPCSEFLHGRDTFVFINRSRRCAQLCEKEGLFTVENRRFAEICLGIWSGLCLISTVFTILTFLLDASSFEYPERPVALLALCYALMSIAVVIRLAAGRDAIACQSYAKESVLVMDGLGNAGCAIVFLLLYYFGLAATLWWVWRNAKINSFLDPWGFVCRVKSRRRWWNQLKFFFCCKPWNGDRMKV